MKHINEFITESIKKDRLYEIQDNFIEWANSLKDENNLNKFEEFKEYIYDNVADFADEYDLSDDELSELTHPANENSESFDKWIENFEEDFK